MKKRIGLLIVSVFLIIVVTGCGGSIAKEYYCDNGDTLKGTSCVKQNTTPAQVQYNCNGKGNYSHLEGNRCVYYAIYGTFSVAANETYYCSSGYLDGSSCIIESTYNAYER